jgi:hypothetical protein
VDLQQRNLPISRRTLFSVLVFLSYMKWCGMLYQVNCFSD